MGASDRTEVFGLDEGKFYIPDPLGAYGRKEGYE